MTDTARTTTASAALTALLSLSQAATDAAAYLADPGRDAATALSILGDAGSALERIAEGARAQEALALIDAGTPEDEAIATVVRRATRDLLGIRYRSSSSLLGNAVAEARRIADSCFVAAFGRDD